MGVAAYDSPDHDRVVPTRVVGLALALDVGQGPVQQDEPIQTQVISNTFEAILVLVGKPPSKCLLGTGENVYYELLRAQDGVMHIGFAVYADQDEWRLERHRGQAVRRHAEQASVRGRHR